MHYVHRLTSRQKYAAITIFMLLPAAALALLMWSWAVKRGYFAEHMRLRAFLNSAQGLEKETPVSFAGIKIGRVESVRLSEELDVIETILKIDKKYQSRIHNDSVATVGALGIIGQKEVIIKGGSSGAPVLEDGDSIPSEELMAMENVMEKLRPIIKSAEETLGKVEEIIKTFPNDRLNRTVEDISTIASRIEKGESSAGKLISTDNAELYKRINALAANMNSISKDVEKASARFPETMEKANKILGDVSSISGKAEEAGRDLPQMRKSVERILDNLDRVIGGVAELAPSLKATAKSVESAAGELSAYAPKVPAILDDVELTLNETLLMVQSLKASWPMKSMVPKTEAPPETDPSLRMEHAAPGGGK